MSVMVTPASWRVWGTAGALVVLAAGTAAWVFPTEADVAGGPWLLPGLSGVALLVALIRLAPWRTLWLLLAPLSAILCVAWNPESPTSTSHFAGACLGVLAMALVAREADTPSRLRLAMLAFLIGGLVTLVVGLAGAPVRVGTMLDVVSPVPLPPVALGLAGLQGGVVNPNALAAAVLLIAPLALAILMIGTGARGDWMSLYPVSLIVLAVGAVTLAICDSRTAWAAIWIMLAAGAWKTGRRRVRLIAGALAAVPVAALAAAVLLGVAAIPPADGELWKSVHDRTYVMTQGFEWLRTSPWFGIGLNEFRTVYQPNPSAAAHAHNMLLQTALDVGLVGSVAYWGIVAWLVWCASMVTTRAPGLDRCAAAGGAMSLVAVSLFGLTDAVPLGAKIGLFQWMAGGLILAASRRVAGG